MDERPLLVFAIVNGCYAIIRHTSLYYIFRARDNKSVQLADYVLVSRGLADIRPRHFAHFSCM